MSVFVRPCTSRQHPGSSRQRDRKRPSRRSLRFWVRKTSPRMPIMSPISYFFEILIGLLADHVARNIRLDHAAEILHVAERGLAHDALCHHAAGNRDLLPLERLEIRPDRIAVRVTSYFVIVNGPCRPARAAQAFAAQAQNLVDFSPATAAQALGMFFSAICSFRLSIPG